LTISTGSTHTPQSRVTEEAVYSSPRAVESCEELKQEQQMKGSAAELLCGRGAMGRRKERMMAKQDAIPSERLLKVERFVSERKFNPAGSARLNPWKKPIY
jgi:hypothetical protein